MRMNPLVLILVVVVVGSGCGGSTSSGPSGSVTGTVAGTTLGVASVVAVPGSSSESGGCISGVDGGSPTCPSSFTREVAVLFTDRADVTCAAIQKEAATGTVFEFANLTYLGVAVDVANGDVVPGTYGVVASTTGVTGATAFLTTSTATCATALELSATSGSVTLAEVSSSHVTGTYSVAFGAQGTFAGSFDVAICDFDAGYSSGPAKQVCQP
jgi:hypothetical protein